jgi:twitching motility protein PilI
MDERQRQEAVDAPDDESAREWVGIALRLAGQLCLVARDEAREVLAVPPVLTRVPGAKSWVRGLANLHGALLPVIDLRQYLGGGSTLQTRQTRILVLNHRELPAGFLVDEVLGFRRFKSTEFQPGAPSMAALSCEPYLAGGYHRGAEQWPVLSLRRLVDNPGFLDVAA